ncbi:MULTISPECIES: TetR/AcrR family transcriptional regulator [unclassified Meridianimarinicoccus]|uniref:TetR/AcrR family transcriptional regulator n=1 Tax=unclassified Meridianimarinicoccus TaxID=2923344 RepID=UPI0018671CF0|nr:TetR/AcrR family transcriptional regulator [Fluviibacterium sp. MJW13]
MNKHDAPIKRGRKFDQVVAGAREVFLREGFEGASVDSIARAAGVSKATLYSYFRDKRLLFLEVARMECLRQAEAAMSLATHGSDPRETLTDMARRITDFTLSDFGLKVFRICVAEAERFPELGRTFYQSGPEVARQHLTDYLQAATARGALRIDDCRLAADQFVELCRADLFYRRVFNLTDNIQPQEVTRIVDGAVDTFLARYAPRL